MVDTYRNCDVNATTDDYNQTPLHIAAQRNHASAVRILLDKSADVRLFDDNSDKPIHVAAQEGHFEYVDHDVHYLL